MEENKCFGACEQRESPQQYNMRVKECIDYLNKELPTFALMDDGLRHTEQSCILMEKGRFYGMANTIDELKNYLTPYTENDYIRGLVYQHAAKFPHKKKVLVDKVLQ